MAFKNSFVLVYHIPLKASTFPSGKLRKKLLEDKDFNTRFQRFSSGPEVTCFLLGYAKTLSKATRVGSE